MRVLSLDQGTSGTKALVVDGDGLVHGAASATVRPRYLSDGRVEVDPQELLESVLVAGRSAAQQAGGAIDAVGLANQGETVLAWEPEGGVPLSTALVWQDRRAESVCAELAADAGTLEKLEKLSGLSLDPYFAAPKMSWLRRHVTSGGVVTTSDAWLLHQLTGEFATDVATASRTMLLDLDTVNWSPVALELFGLAEERLPRLVGCAEPVGSTTAFGGSVPVTGLVVDQPAALAAQGCLTAGSAKCTYGTGAFLLANAGPTAVRSVAGLTGSVAWSIAERPTYCLDGQVYTVGSAVRWLQDIGVLDAPEQLDELAAQADGRSSVVFVPALGGLGAPWWRGEARGALLGLGLSTGRAELVRAVLEGIAAQVAEIVAAVARDINAPLTALRVDGGLTQSAALMQIQADLLGVPVEVSASPHATALGVGALARIGAGGAAGLAEALPDQKPARVYEPTVAADERLERLGRFRAQLERTCGGQRDGRSS